MYLCIVKNKQLQPYGNTVKPHSMTCTTAYPVEVLKTRILRAIKNGNHEAKYILEACNDIRAWANFGEALGQLKREGAIKYNELLEGYYLA